MGIGADKQKTLTLSGGGATAGTVPIVGLILRSDEISTNNTACHSEMQIANGGYRNFSPQPFPLKGEKER